MRNKVMKLTDHNKFEIRFGGAIEPKEDVGKLKLNDLLNLKILNTGENQYRKQIMLELENGKKVWIEAKDDVAAQCLMRIKGTIQKEYLGKNLKELINREFCLAERVG